MSSDLNAERRRKTVLSIVLAVICIIYVLPVLTVVINSFKVNTYVKTDTFALPTGEMWAGFSNFIKGMTFGNYPFWNSVKYSVFITVASTALILLFTSMAAWYIARVNSFFCKVIYYLCVFSMVVPFQMVMFTLSKTADSLQLNTPGPSPSYTSALARAFRSSCSWASSNQFPWKSRKPRPSTAAARCAPSSRWSSPCSSRR